MELVGLVIFVFGGKYEYLVEEIGGKGEWGLKGNWGTGLNGNGDRWLKENGNRELKRNGILNPK